MLIAPTCAKAQFQTLADHVPGSPSSANFEDTTPAKKAYSSLYVEVAGSAIAGALNYERLLSNTFGLRVGFGYAPLSGTNSKGATVRASITSAPLTLSWFPLSTSDTASSDKLEIGAGALYANLSRKLDPFVEFNGIGYTGIIGYRYEPWDGGFLFRIAFTPILLGGNFQPYGGISFGYGF